MAFGFGFGFARNYVSALFSAFSPASLFSGGAPGVWYDPSDYSTLFQDSAGTTPVTAVEQPVGLMLDKSKGLVLGSELVTNGDFSNGTTGWTASNATLSVVDGQLRVTSTGVSSRASQIVSTAANTWYEMTVSLGGGTAAEAVRVGISLDNAAYAQYAIDGTYRFKFFATTATTYITLKAGDTAGLFAQFDNISVKELPGNHAFQSTSASRPVLSARVNKLLATATLATQSVTTRATAHTLRFEGAGTVTLTGTAIGVYTAGTHSITTTAGTLTLTVLGSVTSADLRETNDGVGLPVYQAVVTSTNYTTTGFLPYLKFDGVDDSLSTNSISFTSTDKMSVFAGVRKLTTGIYPVIAELSASANSNNGSFGIFASSPINTTDRYGQILRGTAAVSSETTATHTVPTTDVLASQFDIAQSTANTESTLRVDGQLVAMNHNGTDAGTGNFGNYPLYIGRRGGTTFPFNGQMYSMIIVGKAVTATELSSTETYTAAKTGVTLA